MRKRSGWLLLSFGLGALISCGDDKGKLVDANNPADMPIDADVPNATWDEGGGVLVEFQIIFNPAGTTTYKGVPANHQARFTTYYWKSITPKGYPFPVNPGCNKTGLETPATDADDIFPFGMGTLAGTPPAPEHVYLDVGDPTVSGGANPFTIPLGPNPGIDGFNRHHDGIWHFKVNATTGDDFLDKFDAPYSLALAGSSEWPAQTFTDAIYQSPPWDVTSPGFGPVSLVADQDLVVTWVPPPTAANMPADTAANMVMALIQPGATGIGPIVECITDQVQTGQFTIGKEFVNYVRSFATSGVMARAIVTHRIQELTDGVTHNHKRMDFVMTNCYVVPWTAQ